MYLTYQPDEGFMLVVGENLLIKLTNINTYLEIFLIIALNYWSLNTSILTNVWIYVNNTEKLYIYIYTILTHHIYVYI